MDNLKEKIVSLKKEKNAVILAHYYTSDDVQEIADHVGDSYALAKAAKNSDADVIVFCGVRFMGESAKILNPGKTVLMPDPLADCPMANMADIALIERMREEYDDLAVVCYINSTAEVKCHSDVCVTSSNAVKIVKTLPNKNIFFTPDENLGRFIAQQIPEKNVMLNKGFCHVHVSITEENLMKVKGQHPEAQILAHPECLDEVLRHADYIGSTSGIIEYATAGRCKEYIVCTEQGVEYQLRQRNPDKKFYFVGPKWWCPNMKRNSLEKICHALLTGDGEMRIDDETAKKALLPLEKMLELAK